MTIGHAVVAPDPFDKLRVILTDELSKKSDLW